MKIKLLLPLSFIIFMLGFFVSSCSSSLFSSDNKANPGSLNSSDQTLDDDDDDDDDDSEGGELLSEKEIEAMSFSNIVTDTRRAEKGAYSSFSGTVMILTLKKIGNKRVPESFAKKTKTTLYYKKTSPHEVVYGSKGICPDGKKKITVNMSILKAGSEEILTDEQSVIGARINGGTEIHVGMADDPDHGSSGPAFHNIDTWVVKINCPGKTTKITVPKFPCWDKNIEDDSTNLKCWAIEEVGSHTGCHHNNNYLYSTGDIYYKAECKAK